MASIINSCRISLKPAPKVKILFIAITACVGGNMSLSANPVNISFLGRGIIDPVKNISMKSGKFPTIIIMVAFMQNATSMSEIAIIERIVREQTKRIRIMEP